MQANTVLAFCSCFILGSDYRESSDFIDDGHDDDNDDYVCYVFDPDNAIASKNNN